MAISNLLCAPTNLHKPPTLQSHHKTPCSDNQTEFEDTDNQTEQPNIFAHVKLHQSSRYKTTKKAKRNQHKNVAPKTTAATFSVIADKDRKRPYRLSTKQRERRLKNEVLESTMYNLTLDINNLKQQVRYLQECQDLYMTRLTVGRQHMQGEAVGMVARLFRLYCAEACGYSNVAEPNDRTLFLSRVHSCLKDPSAGGRDGIPHFMQLWELFRMLYTHRSYITNCIRVLTYVDAYSDSEGTDNSNNVDTLLIAEARRWCGPGGGCVVESTGESSGRLKRETIVTVLPHLLHNESLAVRLIGQKFTLPVRLLVYFNSDGLLVHHVAEFDFISALNELIEAVRDAPKVLVPSESHTTIMEDLEALLETDSSPVQTKSSKTKTAKGDGTSVSPPKKNRRLSAEDRRTRHRERMQRMRMAEKHSIEVKRVEVKRLTQELEHAIQRLSTEFKNRQGGGELEKTVKLESQAWHKDQSTAANIVQQRYLSLVLQQETITEENRRLTERFDEWQKFMKLLGVEHDRLPKHGSTYNLTSDLLVEDGDSDGRWVVFSDDEPVIFYQPIERNKCHELAFTGYQQMQEMLQGPGARKVYDEGFGWKIHFTMHEDDSKVQIQHRFTKRINVIKRDGGRITADSLANATWKILNTPELYSRMYRSPRASRVLQKVDAHTCVAMRTFPDENALMYLRCVSLVVRVEDCVVDSTSDSMELTWDNDSRRRVTILTSVLNTDQCFPRANMHTPNPTAEWIKEGMEYISFTEIDGEDQIDIEYGGLVNVGNETTSTGIPHVVMNLDEVVVRWEQLLPCCWRADVVS
ncbi:hypothetical protein BBO99_00006223 [Phytophthora kernoviae]|uniref:Uncharacterized protein n=1 Tax=Phytophthora kernoviae TaxID=325452 RepID=A0A3R7J5W5_9STRA|nr:hypothetical protein JM16_006060 [Phytophthora kernoviae]RLN32150.1 hypothetical protein BBI17_006330 [Phytophthora kernoviae]RLN78082.1 hypothetical protein BBO99_00006223 [Phytophthora kernoviae]